MRDRYYDTNSGRFSRRDEYLGQIQNPLSLHKYIYANANPVSGTDPSGYLTMAEQTTVMNWLTSLSSTSMQVLSNPFIIETAKNWALLLTAGMTSAYLLYKVFEGTKADKTKDVKIYPDNAPDPQENKKSKPYEENKYINRMRLQVQGGGDFGIGLFNTADVGVTVGQVVAATGELYRRKSSFSWLSNKHFNGAFTSGIAFIVKASEHHQKAGGFSVGGTQAATYQWDKSDPAGNQSASSYGPLSRKRWKDYRIDLENNNGHNLRS